MTADPLVVFKTRADARVAPKSEPPPDHPARRKPLGLAPGGSSEPVPPDCDPGAAFATSYPSVAAAGDDAPRRKTQRRRGSKALMIFNRALNNCIGAAGKRMRPFPDGPEVLAVTRETVRAEFMRTYPADDRKAKAKLSGDAKKPRSRTG
jgi:hypothetical protein